MENSRLLAEIRARMESLTQGSITPSEAADWAFEFIRSDSPHLRDPVIHRAIEALSGADLLIGPAEYFHCLEDYEDWLREFGENISRSRDEADG